MASVNRAPPPESAEGGARPRDPSSAHRVERYRPSRVVQRSSGEEIRLGVRIRTLAHRGGIPQLGDRDTKNVKLIVMDEFLSEPI